MTNKTPFSLFKTLKELEPLSLSTHNDSDGIYSASILASIFKVKKLCFPNFHEYNTKVALDLGSPKNKDWNGVLIDHHPLDYHSNEYTLVWDIVPVGLILYRLLKKRIPKERLWYVIGSLVGDGQPELIPSEIWKMFPILLYEKGILYKYMGKIQTSKYPMFYYLSSGVNSFCRLGNPRRAFEIVLDCKSPLEFIEHPEVLESLQSVKVEEENIYKSKFIVESYGRIVFVKIETTREDYKFAGLIASKLYSNKSTDTFVVLNVTNGNVSIRGYLSDLIVESLSKKGYVVGGHSGYAGGKIELNKLARFIEDVRSLRHEIYN